jgi:hypothetical protein
MPSRISSPDESSTRSAGLQMPHSFEVIVTLTEIRRQLLSYHFFRGCLFTFDYKRLTFTSLAPPLAVVSLPFDR